MATLYVAESRGTGGSANFPNPAIQTPVLADQVITIGGSSTQSSAFNADTHLIRVQPDAICSVAIGANPTAATTTMRMTAGQTEYFDVQPGHKIAVITNS